MHSLIETNRQYEEALEGLRSGFGPFAIDTERANRFKYDQEFPWLVQLYRRPTACFIFDTSKIDNLSKLGDLIGSEEVVIHAAINDIKSLKRVGIHITNLFDTEIACRLLNIPKVNLSYVTEKFINVKLRKEYSTVNWSARPLNKKYLEYAEGDVKHLLDLSQALKTALRAENKLEIAKEEFSHVFMVVKHQSEIDKLDKFCHGLEDDMQRAVAKNLWKARDEIARSKDIFTPRILSNKAIRILAKQVPENLEILKTLLKKDKRPFRKQYINLWHNAISRARVQCRNSESQIQRKVITSEKQYPKERMDLAKAISQSCAEKINVPLENLITTHTLKSVIATDISSLCEMGGVLRKIGLRDWQIKALQQPLFDGLYGKE